MPAVVGFLRAIKRRPWHKPGQPLPPDEGGPPDWGIEEGERPEVEPPEPGELPPPPPGVWPGPSAELPWVPVPPDIDVPPGTIWPSPGTPEHPIKPGKKLWILVFIPGHDWWYVCVDPGLLVPKPGNPLPKP